MKTQTKILGISVGILILLIVNLVFVSAVSVESVNIIPKEVEPGKISDIELIMENSLNEDVEEIRVSLDFTNLPFAPYGSSEKTIDELNEGKRKTLEFQVIALSDAKSGIYKIPVEIEYKDKEGIILYQKSLISLTINSKPLIDVVSEEGLFLRGTENVLTIKVINKGLSDVKFLEIGVGKSTYYSLTSQDREYIGDISSDDFDSADFKIFIKENAASLIKIPVTVEYKDVLNREYSEEFYIPIKSYTQKQAIQLGLLNKGYTSLVIEIIAGVIIMYIIYRIIKSRRKKKLMKN